MLIFFTNLILIEFQVRYLALLLLFSAIGGFKWFWMVNPHKNVQLMLEFFKAPFLVLHFSSYTFITLLMKLSVMFLSMLMVLLSILSVNRHQRQQLELASELEFDQQNTMDWAKKQFVDLNSAKNQLVLFEWFNKTGSIDVKMDESPLEEKSYFKDARFKLLL